MVGFLIWELVPVVVFYLLILAIGILAARKSKLETGETTTENEIIAARNIGIVVGTLTTTATRVGGTFVKGIAEAIYTEGYGLISCQAPFGHMLSLTFGGLLFAKKMRQGKYVTMLDPFRQKYGKLVCFLLFLLALFCELCWSAASLSALGSTLAAITGLNSTPFIIISACIAVLYTFTGGLYSVVYTDVVQLFWVFIGLWTCVPFVFTNKYVGDIVDSSWNRTVQNRTVHGWLGRLDSIRFGMYIDSYLLLIFGGIPRQSYFQRVVSMKTPVSAQMMSYYAAAGCFIMCIAPMLIGTAAASADWSKLGMIHAPPLARVIQSLTPLWVASVGFVAISAAALLSTDASILGASCMFTINIFKGLLRPQAFETETIRAVSISVFVVGFVATVMALRISYIFELWMISVELVYIILFPLLFSVFYIDRVNRFGSICGFVCGHGLLFLHLAAGHKKIGFKPFIPDFNLALDIIVQYFPLKTCLMLLNFCVIVITSVVSDAVNSIFRQISAVGRPG